MPAPQDREFLCGIRQDGGSLHKNIAYRPALGKISGTGKLAAATVERLRTVLEQFSRTAIAFAAAQLPRYEAHWHSDYASFRPVEERGRDLPFTKRNDLLHVDAFPTRPTNGGLILRIFTNINPSEDRVWITSDPMAALAARYAGDAGLARLAKHSPLGARQARALGGLGLPVTARSPYDHFMLAFHDYLKKNAEYQQSCPKYRFAFPPGTTWMVFTDVVPHSVESGQLGHGTDHDRLARLLWPAGYGSRADRHTGKNRGNSIIDVRRPGSTALGYDICMLRRAWILSLCLPALACATLLRIEVSERSDVLDGKAFGAAGPYERIVGKAYFAVDPKLPANKIIVDLDKAPRNADGLVEFSSDIYVLKPRDPSHGNGAVFFEVSNRGTKGMLYGFNQGTGSLDPRSAREFGDGFLLEQGYTLVWLGWQFDVPHEPNLLRLYAPVAAGITGLVRRSGFSRKERPANRWPTAIIFPIRP